MTVARVRTVLTGPQIVGGGVCDLHFLGSSGDEDEMADAVAAFWDDLSAGLHTGNVATIDPDVTNFDESDGSIVSIVTLGAPPAPIMFSGSGDPLPPATQGLIQWFTTGIVNNRRVRGRTFVPGAEEAGSTAGVPTSAAIALFKGAADNLIGSADTGLAIWSRPTPSRVGSIHLVNSAQVWTQWAVLRSRRD